MGKTALHDVLRGVLKAPFPDGESHCYFEPPADIQIKYPCIIYNRVGDRNDFADNVWFRSFDRYTIIIVDENPDSNIPTQLTDALRYCSLDRIYATEGLSHFVYTLFYDGPRIKEE